MAKMALCWREGGPHNRHCVNRARETSVNRRFAWSPTFRLARRDRSRPDPPEHRPQQASGQVALGQQKQAAHWTQLSCHCFRANEVRPQLILLAYNLGNLWPQ
jgi:hypothetical protein